jgi:hypothetical protein
VQGALGNGSGPALFAGRTNQATDSIRRALLRFDVAGALPAHAIIEWVSLNLYLNPSNSTPRTVRLHRVLAAWGEGASYSSGGGGAPALPGDVTWLYRSWDTNTWVRAGGMFVARVSAAREVASSGFYTWTSTDQLAADVSLWAAAPDRNFGWILIGDETTSQSVKSFASREEPDPELRPILEITFRTLPADPHR